MTEEEQQPNEPDGPVEPVEPVEPVVPGVPVGEEGRRYPSTIGGVFYLVVIAIVAIGIGIVTTGGWRVGIRWFGGGLLLAALARAVLPSRDAGMLAVRQRWWDCFLLAGTGVALILLAGSIPDQPL